jgi:hypothetical protein
MNHEYVPFFDAVRAAAPIYVYTCIHTQLLLASMPSTAAGTRALVWSAKLQCSLYHQHYFRTPPCVTIAKKLHDACSHGESQGSHAVFRDAHYRSVHADSTRRHHCHGMLRKLPRQPGLRDHPHMRRYVCVCVCVVRVSKRVWIHQNVDVNGLHFALLSSVHM